MTQPTREEVEALRKAVSELSVIENPATSLVIVKQHFCALSDAYLSQEEELNSLVNTLLERDREILAIQAENQALWNANTYLHDQLDKAVNT